MYPLDFVVLVTLTTFDLHISFVITTLPLLYIFQWDFYFHIFFCYLVPFLLNLKKSF